VARGTISGRRRPAGRAPHRLRSARLGAHRSHPTARRTHALAARWRHRRAESDRRARAPRRAWPASPTGAPTHRAALRGAPRVVPLRPRDATDPLAAFMAGELAWTPAPTSVSSWPTALRPASRARREGGVPRRRLLPAGLAVGRASGPEARTRRPRGRALLALGLGRPVEDHLLLASEGDLLRVLEPVVHECPARPMPPEVVGGVAAIVAAGSARPLAPVNRRRRARGCPRVGRGRARPRHDRADRIRVSEGFRAALAERLATAHGRGRGPRSRFAAIVELGVLVGDALRARAQARSRRCRRRLRPRRSTRAATDGRHAPRSATRSRPCCGRWNG